jgi:DNA modification methylase
MAGRWMLYEGDCLEVMRQLPDNSVDAVVTSPPYDATGEAVWRRS